MAAIGDKARPQELRLTKQHALTTLESKCNNLEQLSAPIVHQWEVIPVNVLLQVVLRHSPEPAARYHGTAFVLQAWRGQNERV